jgi:hypothetical protein
MWSVDTATVVCASLEAELLGCVYQEGKEANGDLGELDASKSRLVSGSSRMLHLHVGWKRPAGGPLWRVVLRRRSNQGRRLYSALAVLDDNQLEACEFS